MSRRSWILAALFLFMLALSGCPRVAYIDLYNNTEHPVNINVSGYQESIDSMKSTKMMLGYYFSIESEHGEWSYPRNVPHGGENGPFFDGTLRLQLNPDGLVYVLKVGEVPPKFNFPEQPEGYPLVPEMVIREVEGVENSTQNNK